MLQFHNSQNHWERMDKNGKAKRQHMKERYLLEREGNTSTAWLSSALIHQTTATSS